MERRSEENQIPLQPYNEHGDDPQRHVDADQSTFIDMKTIN